MEKMRRRSSRGIYEEIRNDILTGKKVSGEVLLPIRELAKKLGVSKNTVNAAYKKLLENGYAYSITGSGYYVEKNILPKQEHSYGKAGVKPVGKDGYAVHHTTENWKVFPWPVWEMLLLEKLSLVRKGVDAEKAIRDSNLLIRKKICEHIRKRFDSDISPDNVILCADSMSAIELVKNLFSNISRDIAFLEPCDPMIRRMFQEDSFQVLGFQRRMAKQEGKYEEEKRFRVLFGYLEQYLEEMQRVYPDNLWISNWMNETGSCLLLLDGMETDHVYEKEKKLFSDSRILMIGSYERLLPKEISLAYLVLPDPLLEKFKNRKRKTEQIYPLSYQMALASLAGRKEFSMALEENQKIRRENREKLQEILRKATDGKVKQEETFSYMTDGIVISVSERRYGRNFLSKLEQKGIDVMEAGEFWYFEKEKGENLFWLPYTDHTEEELKNMVNHIKIDSGV